MLANDNIIRKRHIGIISKIIFDKRRANISILRILSGKSNAVYKCVIDNKCYIIKSGHINKKLMLSFEKKLLLREKNALDLMHKQGIKVPKIIGYYPFGTVIKKEFSIIEYIENDKIDDKSKIDFYQLYDVYNDIHDIHGDNFGYIGGKQYDKWYDFICSLSYELLDLASKYNMLNNCVIAGLRKEICNNKELFDRILQPCFVQNDFGVKNILFEEKSGQYEFKALIDFEHSLYGDPDFELARMEMTDKYCFNKIKEFVNYEVDDDRVARFRIYSLLCILISMHIMKVKNNVPIKYKILKNKFIELYINES